MTVQMDKKKNYIIVGVISTIFVIGAAAIFYTLNFGNQSPTQPYSSDERVFTETEIPSSFNMSEDLIKFSSNEEVVQFLKDATQFNSEFPTHGGLVRFDRTTSGVLESREAFVVSEPAPSPEPESANIVLKIGLDIEQQDLQNMFLNDDRLVIFYYGSGQSFGIQEYDFMPYPIYQSKTFATIIDVSDKENPKTVTTYEIDGNYNNSRMIGDMVYLITNNYVDYVHPIIPRIMESSQMIIPDVYRFPNPEENYNFNTITAFDFSGTLKESETFLM